MFFIATAGRDDGHAIDCHPPSGTPGPPCIRDAGGACAGPGGAHGARDHLHPDRLGRGPDRDGPRLARSDQQGALQLLAGTPYGTVSLWLLGIGFAAYALWRVSEAAFGVTGDRNGAGPRPKSLGRAVIYAAFALPDAEGDLRHAAQPGPPAAGCNGQGHAASRRAVAGRDRRRDHRPHRPGAYRRGDPPQVHEIPADVAAEPGDTPRGQVARRDRDGRPGPGLRGWPASW